MALTTFQCGTNLGSWAFGAISESFGKDVGCLSVVTQSRFAVGPIAASWMIVDGNFATVTGTALLYRSSRAR